MICNCKAFSEPSCPVDEGGVILEKTKLYQLSSPTKFFRCHLSAGVTCLSLIYRWMSVSQGVVTKVVYCTFLSLSQFDLEQLTHHGTLSHPHQLAAARVWLEKTYLSRSSCVCMCVWLSPRLTFHQIQGINKFAKTLCFPCSKLTIAALHKDKCHNEQML